MKRRQFLARSIAGLGTVAIAPSLIFAQSKPALTYDPCERFELGRTKIKVSRMCLGTGMRGGGGASNHTRMGTEKFHALIRGAYERGVRVFDLADLYGTHPYIIPALKDVPRKDIAIFSKLWFRKGGMPTEERPDADIVVQRFLKEIKTDYIDLLLLHCTTDKDWNTKLESQMKIMDDLKKKGIIRAHGVSCHSLDALKTAADEPWVDSVHVRINAYGDKMDASPEEVAPVVSRMHKAGKGIVGMKLIGEGLYRDSDEKRDKSLKYVLDLGAVDVLNVGFEKIEEIDDYTARVRRVARINA
jgi:aryl-alcohol dehydrogenase-like predicted oxidoreductase